MKISIRFRNLIKEKKKTNLNRLHSKNHQTNRLLGGLLFKKDLIPD